MQGHQSSYFSGTSVIIFGTKGFVTRTEKGAAEPEKVAVESLKVATVVKIVLGAAYICFSKDYLGTDAQRDLSSNVVITRLKSTYRQSQFKLSRSKTTQPLKSDYKLFTKKVIRIRLYYKIANIPRIFMFFSEIDLLWNESILFFDTNILRPYIHSRTYEVLNEICSVDSTSSSTPRFSRRLHFLR